MLGVAGRERGFFLGGIGLAGKKRLVNVKVARLDQPRIGRDEIAGREKKDIAGHDLRGRNIDRLSIAKRVDGERDALAQTFGGVLGLPLLRHVEDHRHENNDGDDDEACNVSGECRYARRKKQNDD